MEGIREGELFGGKGGGMVVRESGREVVKRDVSIYFVSFSNCT